MKVNSRFALFAPGAVGAFTPLSLRDSSSSRLAAYPTNERVLKQGGGIATVASGNRLLFDPSEQGILGGTSDLDERLSRGTNFHFVSADYLPQIATPPKPQATQDAQAWLEDIPIATPVKAGNPMTATVMGRARLIDANADGDIEHVLLKLPDDFPYYQEGQSLSVIPSGLQANGKPHKPRLYSIASTRYGDLLDGRTVSLCVRRADYVDPATGLVDPTKAGVCSNFLCQAQPGDAVSIAGPVGKTMMLPQDLDKDIIMVATGTGIAPFRGFLHRLFVEKTIARHQFNGQAWLILGVPTSGNLLYKGELDSMQESHCCNEFCTLKIDYAISREMQNSDGSKVYVQHILRDNASELFQKLEQGAHIYFCGLKGMMPGILEALEDMATSQGMDWAATLNKFKTRGQWHVEVY